MTHDMHDGTVAQGDTWLSAAVPALLSSPAFTRAAVAACDHLGRERLLTGNEVATLVIAKGVPAGFRSQVP